jgi:hypothetical protein
LSKLLGLSKRKLIINDIQDDTHLWNAHLFHLSKRKCLIFINKSSLYSFVALDILKKDLGNFSEFFTQCFIRQLSVDHLLTEKFRTLVNIEYENIMLMTSDNDKKVIGSMNDCIYRIKVYENMKGGIEYLNSDFLGQRLNETPMGSLKYIIPSEAIKEIIRNHT